ncbi:MAG TPA: lanthionine synthetase LanC family protein [Blastocatellia bacterium]|nr:lanthionine synthetase LanC family protein [Blastocatellia bacterium]
MRILIASLLLLVLTAQAGAANDAYRQAALDAARWIRASAIKTDAGIGWPSDPRDPKTLNTSLYSGTTGVILFFLEAYRSTGDKSYLDDARSGADHLLSALDKEKDAGLYTGLAGIGFALQETYKVAGDERYRRGARRCAELIRERAIKQGGGVEWNDITDVISGSAGVGLFMLYAARELKEPAFRQTASEAALRLIELGKPEAGGLKWAMSPRFPRLMPNFSHGTAGIAYFLATVYSETKEAKLLEASLAGAMYLQSIAKTEGDVCMIFHNEPDGKELYYLGWCHGPVGTARLFYRLFQVTNDRKWLDLVKKAARGIIESGIPEKQTAGLWNNVSQCCGSAGVAEFFLSLYQIIPDRAYLDFSKRVTTNLLARASRNAKGASWVQAEHRVKPELLVAQIGYMQGAAGIGMWLLRLDGFERKKKVGITLPDSPF